MSGLPLCATVPAIPSPIFCRTLRTVSWESPSANAIRSSPSSSSTSMSEPESAPVSAIESASTSRKRRCRSSESASASRISMSLRPVPAATSNSRSHSSMGAGGPLPETSSAELERNPIRSGSGRKMPGEIPARRSAAAPGDSSDGSATRSGFRPSRSSGSVERGIWRTSAMRSDSDSGSALATRTKSMPGAPRAVEMRSTRSSGRSRNASFMGRFVSFPVGRRSDPGPRTQGVYHWESCTPTARDRPGPLRRARTDANCIEANGRR